MTAPLRSSALLLALSLGTAPLIADAQNAEGVGDFAQQLHSTIPAQGNQALRKLHQTNRDQIREMPTDFLPPRIWSLTPPPAKQAAKS